MDEADHPVENANNRIEVSVEGAGWLTGLDNGDSTDMDEYKGSSRRLFSGKLLILAAIGENAGNLRVSVSSQGLTGAWMQIPVAEGKKSEEFPCCQSNGTKKSGIWNAGCGKLN